MTAPSTRRQGMEKNPHYEKLPLLDEELEERDLLILSLLCLLWTQILWKLRGQSQQVGVQDSRKGGVWRKERIGEGTLVIQKAIWVRRKNRKLGFLQTGMPQHLHGM